MLRAAFVAATVAALTPATAAAVTKVEAPKTGSVFITGSPANDHLAVSRSGRLVTVTRFALPAEPLLAGTGCSGDTGTVRCEMPTFGLDDLNYQDAGGNDVFRGNGYPQPLHLNGGPGADDLTGGLGSDYVSGGSGDSRLDGGPGNDHLQGQNANDVLDDGPGNDDIKGGGGDDVLVPAPGGLDSWAGNGGFDTITYAGPSAAGVRVSLDGVRGDGQRSSGEQDNVRPSVDRVVGSAKADVLTGGDVYLHNFVLEGGGGDDVLAPGGRLSGTTMVGGPGRDRFRGGPNHDTIEARDGEPDVIEHCGSWASGMDVVPRGADVDVVQADGEDLARGIPEDCESVDARQPSDAPNVIVETRTARVRRGRIAVRLHCPEATGRLGCKGTLALSASGRKTRRKRYAIKASRRATVRVRFGAGRRRARLLSVEKGRLGPRTTRRLLKVKR